MPLKDNMHRGTRYLLAENVPTSNLVSRVADTELLLLIAHLIGPPGSTPGVGRVRRNQTKKLEAKLNEHE